MEKLGIVLATYNEADNLPKLVVDLEELPLPAGTTIYVVDDNSPDGTSDVVQGLMTTHSNIFLNTRPGKLGLGSALREGITPALDGGCTHVLTMDADLSHRAQDVPGLLAMANSGDPDLVVGSRYVKGGQVAGWEWHRRLQSRTANLLCRWLLGTPHEASTNFKVYNQRAAQLVVEHSRRRDYEFQLESVLLAMKHGLRIAEVPITFANRRQGKSKLGVAQTIKGATYFAKALVTFRLGIGQFANKVRRRSG